MLLKAGTYRFNDVLEFPYNDIEQNINFTMSVTDYAYNTGDYVVYCSSMTFQGTNHQTGLDCFIDHTVPSSVFDSSPMNMNFEGVWSTTAWGEGIKSVTITEDTEVIDEFGTTFIANTNYNEVNPSLKIGETRLFNNTITGVNESETVIHDSFRFTLGNGVQQYGMQMANGRLYYDGTVDSFYQVATGYILHDYATFIDDKYRTIVLQELPTDPDIIALIENNSSVVEDDSTRYLIKKTTLTGIANAIRSKSGKTDLILGEDMASEIEALNVVEDDDSIVGTWVFKSTLTSFPYTELSKVRVDYTLDDDYVLGAIQFQVLSTQTLIDGGFISDDAFESESNIVRIENNNITFYATKINIMTEPTDETFITWLKANATKQ